MGLAYVNNNVEVLDAFVSIDAPVILDPDSGLAITDFYGAIEFGQTLPSITSAKDLVNNAAFTPPSQQTLAEWQAQLGPEAAALIGGSGPSGVTDTSSFTIQAGATLYDAYATENAFQLQGGVEFDTTGKMAAIGTLTLGDSLTVNGGIYVDFSQITQGQATILAYADVPVPSDASAAPLVGVYGGITFAFSTTSTDSGLGDGLDLNGSTDYASAGIDLNDTSYTVELWAQRNDTGYAETLIDQYDATTGSDVQIGFDASDDFVVSTDGTTFTYATAAGSDGDWHLWDVVFSSTAGSVTAYVHGKELTATSQTGPSDVPALDDTSTGSTLWIGRSGSTYFDGSVDEVRVWMPP